MGRAGQLTFVNKLASLFAQNVVRRCRLVGVDECGDEREQLVGGQVGLGQLVEHTEKINATQH